MENHIPAIDELIKLFAKLPGLGPKSAKRIILKLINNKAFSPNLDTKKKGPVSANRALYIF